MLVIGAKGFAKELVLIINKNEYPNLVFFDDISTDLPTLFFNKFPILTSTIEASNYFKNIDNRFILGIGNPTLRCKLAEMLISYGGCLTSIYAATALVGGFDNTIGDGVVLMHNVIIETSNSIGQACLLHNNAFVSHDVVIGNYCEISPSVNLLGNVTIGNLTSIGTNATVLPGITIGNNVIVGAGSVVLHDVPDNVMVAGVPASIKKVI